MNISAGLAIPVYNEAPRVEAVLKAARRWMKGPIVVIDDGSTDATCGIVRGQGIEVVQHAANRGYGAALRTGFEWAAEHGVEWCITMDADWQHEPAHLPGFLERLRPSLDIVSGSRYLDPALVRSDPPTDRRWVNQVITELLASITGYPITDAFCGFRAYRVDAVKRLALQDPGYAWPVEMWIKSAHCGLNVEEIAVPLIYHDYEKGVGTRPARERLAQYLSVAAEVLRWTSSS